MVTELGGDRIAYIEKRLRLLRDSASRRTGEAVGLAEVLLTEVHRLRLVEARAAADRAYYDLDDEGDT